MEGPPTGVPVKHELEVLVAGVAVVMVVAGVAGVAGSAAAQEEEPPALEPQGLTTVQVGWPLFVRSAQALALLVGLEA